MSYYKNVNKEIYEGRVTQQVPSFVYEDYIQDDTFSLSTVTLFTIMASKSENYEFNKSDLYNKYGRRIVDKAFKEMMLAGHLIQINYSLASNKRKVAIKFFVEPRTSSEVSRIVNTLLSTRFKNIPSAAPSNKTLEYINKGVKLQRDFEEAKRRMKRNSEGGWIIEVEDTEELIPCKERPRIGGNQVFYIPLEMSKEIPAMEDGYPIESINNIDFLLDGIYEIEGVKESPEFDSIQKGYAHKKGNPIFTDIDGAPTNTATIREDILNSNFIVGEIYTCNL
ncbi:hypothetical protein CN613_10295 [Bacillus pseudomycoides]|uniref:Uncharacterized protein n=1 Tax=Bacillus pseudomycoides TaxID=64104 RepID=A0A2A8C622_9BACI|nr:hypothetical protein [Bacillus pseudomycoides]PEM69787.1 hypothetical protein CN613_10295 [Bacillus pseudomycoides]PFZ14756.1 hypothetical protein COL63_08575 [Bacillus pseudomycoides]